MTIEQLKALLNTNVDTAITVLDNVCLAKNLADTIKQYLPKGHDVNDLVKRPDKPINGEDGRPEKIVKVNRLSLPIQQNIVTVAAAFLGVPELHSAPETDIEQTMLSLINKVREDCKYQYAFKDIVKTTKSEKECAVLWYTQKIESDFYEGYDTTASFQLKLKILSHSRGDKLYPVFDTMGDMIAFARKWEVCEYDSTGKEDKICYLDVYTADEFYFYRKRTSGSWELYSKDNDSPGAAIPNPFKKIPVIYFCQPHTDWDHVQQLIDRLEYKISNHADTNDYFDSPIVFIEGEIEGFSEKGESGKVLMGKNGAKASYITWDNAPESMKMEIENLLMFIDKFTHTPDISFDKMKGLGAFSGIALKMFFLDAHLKAADSEEIFGEGEQRTINYLKAAFSVMDTKLKPALKLTIKPVFNYFLPQNTQEMIDVLAKATSSDLLSNETAIHQNPLVEDADAEIKRIKKEQTSADEREINKNKSIPIQ